MFALLLACGQFVDGVPADVYFADNASVGDIVVSEVPDGAQIIDARPLEDYARGHAPGAVSVHWSELGALDDDGLWDTKSPESLGELFASRGLDNEAPIVVMGASGADWGGDGAIHWALSYLGVSSQVLNGGYAAWLAAGGGVTKQEPGLAHGDFEIEVDPSVLAHSEDVAKWQGNILDARSAEEWVAGHVPGAVWMEWSEVLAPTGALRGEDEIEALLVDAGLDPALPTVVYCQAGVRAGHTWMVLEALGWQDTANYVGSWARWSAEGRPTEQP